MCLVKESIWYLKILMERPYILAVVGRNRLTRLTMIKAALEPPGQIMWQLRKVKTSIQ
jgi:hypothetical protein